MKILLDLAWALSKFLSYGGLVMALGGVAVFGWHFVRLNAAAAKSESGDIPAAAWNGPGARLGGLILAGGVVVAIAAIVLGASLPGRT